MSENFENIVLSEQNSAGGRAAGDAFLVVAIQANRNNRFVEVAFVMDGKPVGRMTAADNYVADVISSSGQITTIPLPSGTQWEIRSNVSSTDNEVRIWIIRF